MRNFLLVFSYQNPLVLHLGLIKTLVRCTKQLNVMHNKGSKKVVHEQAKSKENRDQSKNRHGSKLITFLYT